MSHLASGGANNTYLNPVYPKSFPDPFVLKYDGRFYGYSTGFAGDGTVFEVITSEDLISWSEIGGAMTPLEPSPPFYWAPEVTYSNGKFYLYYSVGNETFMEIRVAVSDKPDGGFADSGHRLTHEDFAIDAHVFIDEDGSKYLFYATDFLEHTHIGTGTVVDRMTDWFTLAGTPRPVTRAKYDWQVYDPNRIEKGGVRWHTVEGPTILKRKGTYYEMFSGGNWQNTTYGVSFAVSNRIGSDDEWEQFSDGNKILPILRTEPGLIIGPGHNSVVRGPNNRELYCVYHRWTDAGRVLAVDRMDFAGNRIFVVGATHTPQIAPFAPLVSENNSVLNPRLGDLPSSFLCEINFRACAAIDVGAETRFQFATSTETVDLILDPISGEMRFNDLSADASYELQPGFNWSAKHLMRIESDYRKLRVTLDNTDVTARVRILSDPISHISMLANGVDLEMSSFEVTEGFEEMFEDELPLEMNGWTLKGDAGHRVDAGELLIDANSAFEMFKHRPLQSSEFAVNFRVAAGQKTGTYGLGLRQENKDLLRLMLDLSASRLTVDAKTSDTFPVEFALNGYHQLRIIKSGTEALCYVDDRLINTVDIEDVQTTAFILCERVSVAIEMIRLTAI